MLLSKEVANSPKSLSLRECAFSEHVLRSLSLTHTRTHIHTHMQACTHTHTLACTHTHTHTHTHTLYNMIHVWEINDSHLLRWREPSCSDQADLSPVLEGKGLSLLRSAQFSPLVGGILLLSWCFMSTETIRLIRDGQMEVGKEGEGGIAFQAGF